MVAASLAPLSVSEGGDYPRAEEAISKKMPATLLHLWNTNGESFPGTITFKLRVP